jgi:hypothetical protein
MLSVVVVNAVMLNVANDAFRLNVVMLSVVAPLQQHSLNFFCQRKECEVTPLLH